MSQEDVVLVTGGTGALGSATLSLLRERLPDARFVVLTRQAPASDRLAGLTSLRVDLSRTGFAGPELRRALTDVTAVIHLAADVRWNRDLRSALAINAFGTRRLLRAVSESAPRLRRFVHVSTAFVDRPAGCEHCPSFLRRDGLRFSNTYEFSKWIAERHVRESGLPWSIVRPSLIVGDSQNGRIARFNGLYHLYEFFVRGRLPFIVGDPDGYVDLVPVDVAAEAVVAALLDPSLEGRTLFAGSGPNAPSLAELIDLSVSHLNAYREEQGISPIAAPAVLRCESYRRLIQPLLSREMLSGQRRLLEMAGLFHPYTSLRRRFDPSPETRAILGRPFSEYGAVVIRGWCDAHPRLAAGAPHVWQQRPTSPPIKQEALS